jgi:predicted homoserine dehydrogenase-like protein
MSGGANRKRTYINIHIGVVGAGNMGADHVSTLHCYVSDAVAMVADIEIRRLCGITFPDPPDNG